MASGSYKSSLCETSKSVNKFVSKYWSCLHPDSIELLKPLTKSTTECQNAQLSTVGVKQHRSIGRFLRNKYRKLVQNFMLERMTLSL